MIDKNFWLEAENEEFQTELERVEAELERVLSVYVQLAVEKDRLKKEIEWIQDPENTVECGLLANSKEWLMECAGYLRLKATGEQKEEIAHQLAEYLLTPESMKEELFWFSEMEMDVFEKVIEEGSIIPTSEEEELLGAFWDIGYACVYGDEKSYRVPADARALYARLRKEGYRDIHRKMQWLRSCMDAFERIYAFAPIKVLHRMYRKDEELRMPYQQFLDLFAMVPKLMNPFRVDDGGIMSTEFVGNRRYQELEQQMPDIGYYIPEKEEILEYAEHDYPASQKDYRKLWLFARAEWNLSDTDATKYCVTIHNELFTAGILKDSQNKIGEYLISFPTRFAAETFVDIIKGINANTRMPSLRGHTETEMKDFGFKALVGMTPTIQKRGSKFDVLLTDARMEIMKLE